MIYCLEGVQELDVSKSPGPDGWHQRFRKESAEQLTVPLRILFSKQWIYSQGIENSSCYPCF